MFRNILTILFLLLVFHFTSAQQKKEKQDSLKTGTTPVMNFAPPDNGGGGGDDDDDNNGGGGGTGGSPTDPDLAAPPPPQASTNYCGYKTLTSSGSPPSNAAVTWFWQTSSRGTSVAHSYNQSFTAKTTGSYYLRATRPSNGSWGPPSSVYVTVHHAASPEAPTIDVNGCDNAVLTRTTPPPGVTYFWQGTSSTATSSSNPAEFYTATSSGKYYIRARQDASGCWSGPREVTVTLEPRPDSPPEPDVIYFNGVLKLERAEPNVAYYTYYWKDEEENVIGTQNPLYGSPSQIYYLVTKNETNGCWSVPVATGVNPGDIPPFPNSLTMSDNTCGNKTLHISQPSSAANYKFYWQGKNEGGKSQSDDAETFNATSNGRYYIRGKNKTKDIWGPAASVDVVIISAPGEPVAVDKKQIGKQFAKFKANGGTGKYLWYNKQSGGDPIDPTPSSSLKLLIDETTTKYAMSVNSYGCISNREPVTVTVYPLPEIETVGQEEINIKRPWVELTTQLAYDSYQWYRNDQKIIGANERNYVAKKTGFYKVNVSKNGVNGNVMSDPFRVKHFLQAENRSYSVETVLKKEGVKELSDVIFLPDEEKQVSVAYFDRYGRKEQSILVDASPSGKDIIQGFYYDQYGRASKSFLPYTTETNTAAFQDSWQSRVISFYYQLEGKGQTQKPFSEAQYEDSPRGRMTKSGAPGEDWQISGDHAVSYEVMLNDGSKNIRVWEIDETTGLPISENPYSAGQLNVSSITDEEGNTSTTYTNEVGEVILKVGPLGGKTYSIYDDFGLLRYVLQPTLVKSLEISETYTPSQAQINAEAFYYQYDGRHRMVEKKVPGTDPLYMVYDNRDRLVLTQDGNQSVENEWLFTKYDVFGRPVLSGIYTNNTETTRKAIQNLVNNYYENLSVGQAWYESVGSVVHGYDNASFPQVADESNYLTVTYYDNYGFKNFADFGSAYDYDESQIGSETTAIDTYIFPTTPFDRVKGLVTGNKVKVLDGNNTWLRSAYYYDNRYRAIQSASETYSGNIDHFSALYDFQNHVLATFKSYHSGGTLLGIKRRYVYDYAGRLMKGYHEIFENGVGQGEVLLAQNKYNEIGELIEKNLHVQNNVPQQSVDYRYNIRGWLKSVNNSSLTNEPGVNEDDENQDLFGMELMYTDPFEGVTNE